LQELGQSHIREKFFDLYHDYLKEDKESDVLICNSVLLDSTGAQNDIKIPLTAISNHNGIINNEFRVIYVVDHDRNLPIYMNQVPGNIVDISTLKYMVNLLQMRKILVKCFVLDAGYYSEENLNYLDSNNINFLIRMCNNRKLYKDLIDNESLDLSINFKYRIYYRHRFLHCKKITLNNGPIKHYAYVILDFDKKKRQG
jgi:transposase